MKVDKAVCTNDTFEDLNRAIRYDAVFSTLVENKILAIKRECEEHERTKESKRTLGGIISGKHIFCIKRNSPKESGDFVLKRCDNIKMTCHPMPLAESSNPTEQMSPSSPFQQPLSSPASVQPHPTILSVATSASNETAIASNVKRKPLDSGGGKQQKLQQQQRQLRQKTDGNELEMMNADNKKNEILDERGPCGSKQKPVVNTERQQQTYDAEFSVERFETDSISSDKSKKITFQGDCYVEGTLAKKTDGQRGVTRRQRKPSEDTNSSVTSSFIEIYVSNESLRKSPIDSTETISYPSSSRPHTANVQEAAIILDQERRRLRVLEAKSISAQCSPIFPRPTRVLSYPAPQQQLQQPHDDRSAFIGASRHSKVLSRRNTSDDSGASVTFSDTVTDSYHERTLKPEAKLSIKSAKDSGAKMAVDKDKLGSNNSSSHGFINSFNQLTSKNALPVITTTKLRSSNLSAAQLHRLIGVNDGNISDEDHYSCRSKCKKVKNCEPNVGKLDEKKKVHKQLKDNDDKKDDDDDKKKSSNKKCRKFLSILNLILILKYYLLSLLLTLFNRSNLSFRHVSISKKVFIINVVPCIN